MAEKDQTYNRPKREDRQEDHEEVEDVEGARRQRLRDDVQPRLAREYLEEARREHEGVDHEPAVEVVQQKGTWAQYEESRSWRSMSITEV